MGITVKSAVYDLLNNMQEGYQFNTNDLVNKVSDITGRKPFHDTVLRHVRYWRVSNREVKCINRRKSIYIVGGRV